MVPKPWDGFKPWHLKKDGTPYPHSSVEVQPDGSTLIIQHPVLSMAWGYDWWVYLEGRLTPNPWFRTRGERLALAMSW